MSKDTLSIGLDTDKKWIDIAVAEPLPRGEVRYYGKIANDQTALLRVIKRLGKDGLALRVCYEAGPCGYAIHRWLAGVAGVSCEVIAPSLTPRRPGERVKTNRRDCLTLARLLRAEELTAVWVPDVPHEAMRDLVRLRLAARSDLMRCRQRIAGLLLRQHLGYAGKPWTKKHRAWLGRLAFDQPAHRVGMGRHRARSRRVEEIIVDQETKRFMLRTQAPGCADVVCKAVGVALPPLPRQLPALNPSSSMAARSELASDNSRSRNTSMDSI